MSSCDQPSEPALREFFEIHVLLKSDLLKDTKACANFVDVVNKVVDFSFFVRCEA